MKKKLTTVTFNGTPEQEAKLIEIIEKYNDTPGKMMPILQDAQEVYGYLPIEVMKIIAEKTGEPLEKIYGVASFYSQFSLNPKGKVAIGVCLGTACYVKGSGPIIERIETVLGVPAGSTSPDGMYSLEATRCIGACGLAPVFTVNGEVYGRISKMSEVDAILAKYKA